MSTTDTRCTDFEAWAIKENYAFYSESERRVLFYGVSGTRNAIQKAWEAGIAQAATEAAKATSVAPEQTKQSFENIEELVPLPEPWERGDGNHEGKFLESSVRAYGQACAEAARQPAPVAAVVNEAARLIQLWLMDDDVRRAMGEPYNRDAARKITAWPELLRDSIPFSAALAATAAPVLSDEQIDKISEDQKIWRWMTPDGRTCIDITRNFARAILAATKEKA